MIAIGRAIAMYFEDHGRPPPSLDHLVEAGLLSPDELMCPLDTRPDQFAPYVYVAVPKIRPSEQLSTADPEDLAILVHEPIGSRQIGGSLVVLENAAVKWCDERELETRRRLLGTTQPAS